MGSSEIIVFILFAIFALFITYSYNIYKIDVNSNEIYYDKQNDRVRCPPKILVKHDPIHKDEQVYKLNLFSDQDNIKNQGFVNELMYKPSFDSKIEYSNHLQTPNIELNDYRENKNMHFANVHFNYLLENCKK